MGNNQQCAGFTVASNNYFIREWHHELPVIEGDNIAIDTETYLIKDYEVPDMVLATVTNGSIIDIVMWHMAQDYFRVLLRKNANSKLIFFNAPFDIAVLKKMGIEGLDVALDERRIVDVMTRYQIEFIADKGFAPTFYNLKHVANSKLGIQLDKDDSVRLTFTREVMPDPIQLKYAAMDTAITYELAMVMPEQPNEYIDVRSSIVLSEMTRNGMWVDTPVFKELSRRYSDTLEKYIFDFKQWGVRAKEEDRSAAVIRKEICNALKIPTIPNGRTSAKTLLMFLMANIEMPLHELSTKTEGIAGLDPKVKKSTAGFTFNETLSSLCATFGIPGMATITSEMPYLLMCERIIESKNQGLDLMETTQAMIKLYEDYGGWEEGGGLIKIGDFIQKELARVELKYGIQFDRTDKKGIIQFTKEDHWMIGAYGIESQALTLYLQYKAVQRIVSTFLKDGTIGADGRVHPRFNNIVSTFRTSSDHPNFQQLPKKGGIREMYGAPPGKLLVTADFSQIELCALAEHCLVVQGSSKMAELINAGVDLHYWFAAKRLGKITPENDYDGTPESVEKLKKLFKECISTEERSASKMANFGLPGGMQPPRLLAGCRNSGMTDMTLEAAEALWKSWFEAWPEMTEFMKPTAVQTLIDGTYVTRYTATNILGRKRGPCSRNEACNFKFQSLTGLAVKCVLWDLYRAGYKLCNFVHDEVIIEIDDNEHCGDEVKKIEEIMISSVAKVIRHIKIKVESSLSYRWSKQAKAVYDQTGKMIPWTPTLTQ